jgi:hypothetical protein
MKKLLVIFLLTLTVIPLYPSRFSFAIIPGFGFYSMKTLANFNKDVISMKHEIYPVDYKTVEDYPGNLYIDFQSRYLIKENHYLGLGYQYHSTGSRISYKDYSGELKTDIINEANVFYLLYNRKYPLDEYMAITLMINYNLVFTNMDILDYIQLGREIITEKVQCYSFSHALTVGFDFTRMYGQFECGLRVSFMHDMNDLLVSGKYFIDQDGTSREFGYTEAEWNGLRAGFLFAYHL